MQNATTVVHDKLPCLESDMSPKMHCTALESPLNCLAVNKDCSQVVVAGRNVFKIFDIADGEFVERINLRVGRSLNLNFSAADVTWNPIDGHLLASAATNGAVVLWNLNKPSRSKQEHVFVEHRQAVNRVAFHYSESNLLISGSRDGSMKLFDLRKETVTTTFGGHMDSVRDVQFNPHHYFMFASAYENGSIQLWDMRNPSRWERQFTAHSGPIFSIDWHPEEHHWIGSASRDKMIRVWDLQNPSKVTNTYNIQTIASVARIRWRPQRKFHIASCALLLDFNVNVWDVRRPYIPFAAFSEHKDVVTGIVWKHGDPHTFLSSSKDCMLYQHLFRDATRPADAANPVGIDINPTGSILYASSDKLAPTSAVTLSHRPNKTLGGGVAGSGSSYAQRKLSSLARRAAQQQQQPQPLHHQGELQFTLVMSMLTEFAKIDDEDLSMKWFVESAKRYQLTGRPLEELCEHNATVALNLQRHQVAQSWNIIKLLFSATPSTPVSGSKGISTLPSKQDTYKDTDTDRGRANSEGKHLTHDARHTDTADSRDTTVADTSTGVSDEESDVQQDLELVQRSSTLTYIASGMGTSNHSDFFFGDGDMDQMVFENEHFPSIQNCQDWTLPPESFQPRYDIDDTSTAPDHVTAPTVTPTCGDSPSSANESELGVTSHHVTTVAVESNIRQEILSTRAFLSQVPVWPYTQLVIDMLYYYAEQGDVQMTVSVLIVLGEKLRSLVDETLQQLWLMSYIDLLGRFQLWCVANEVIKLSNHSAVTQLNQQSTTIHTNCSKCSKPQLRAGWACERCQSIINTCSICHHPVKGLYVWCQGCCHGGHLEHIREWLLRYKHCPAGCGHYCEYT